VLVIDAANVIGSRPTGWWRDRPGAARRFIEQVRATVAAGRLDPPITVVLEGQARAGAAESTTDGVEVVHARGEGDDTIVDVAARAVQPRAVDGDEATVVVTVVTADRALAARVRANDAEVVGPSSLLARLVEAPTRE
jgi:hypothetical protein